MKNLVIKIAIPALLLAVLPGCKKLLEIKSESSIIVTFNKKDFPTKSVKPHSIEIKGPDEFVVSFLKSNLPKVIESFSMIVNALKKPPQTQYQVLTTLENCGLTETVAKIRKALLQYPL